MSKNSTFFSWALCSLFIYGFAIIQAVACNTTPVGCSGYKTYQQCDWGATCGTAPSLLQSNFSSVFPGGIEIGCTNKLKFTSSTAVKNYLPQGGSSTALASGVKTNQTSGGGTFGGELLALAINIKMDLALTSFASSSGNLKNLIITSGIFKNWTVQAFFDEANKKIGGCTAANFTYSQYSDVAASINKNYDKGSVNKGYLNCPPIVASGVVTNVSCKSGNNGTITLTVSGGFPPYTFKWGNGSTNQNRTGLIAGGYSVTIKDKINQSLSLNFTVTQPSSALTASTAGGVTNVTTYNGTNGKVNLTVSGGTSPYTYLWSNGATTKDLTNVKAGVYSVTVTDARGCKATASACVTQPNPPVCNISASVTKTDVKCNGGSTGSVTLTVNGGTAPITYTWSNGAISKDLTNVAAGTYSVLVKDKNNCTATASATVGQPEPLDVTGTPTDVICNGGSTGSVSLSVSGGTSPYTYHWSNNATSKDISGVAEGAYSVIVTDAKGCTNSENVVVGEPDPIVATFGDIVDVKCYGEATGSIAIYSVNGGTGEYTYLWSNGATTQDLTDVVAGTYSVVVKDEEGCTSTFSATIDQPTSPLSASTEGGVIDANCNGSSTGSVNLTVSGGTTDYTFLWSNGATTEDLTGVAAGTYSVTVTDANGCTTTSSAMVSEPTPVTGNGSTTPTSGCATCDGTATVTPSGGTPDYTYVWSNGTTGTAMLTSLCAQSDLSVTVTDANGCSKVIPVGPITYKQGCVATQVVDYFQGTRQDFTSVDAARSNPNTMKGTPENNDILGTFYALGFGGWAILKVDGSVIDKPGNDIRVVEVTWHEWHCAQYTEKALIEISQDGVTWYNRGIICQDADIDIAPLPCITYVRITDVSDRNDFLTAIPLADGFDVDGIICLQPGVTNARGAVAEENPALTPDHLKSNYNAAALVKKSVRMYPNPVEGKVNLNLEGVTEGQSLLVTVMDHTGREIKTVEFSANSTSHHQEINTDNLSAGLYMVQVKGEGVSYTQKIVKK